MIVKNRETRQSEIDSLTSLLSLNLSEQKKFMIQRELNYLKLGDRGENDSAYFLDFNYGSSKNLAVIHDLRVEFDGKVAQIDHLLINRCCDFFVLETKNFSYGLKITDEGEFLVLDKNNKYHAIESPIEQNKRHIFLLEKIIDSINILPTRVGFLQLTPKFWSYILVSPKSRIIRPSKNRFDTSMVIKGDSFTAALDKNIDSRSVLSVVASISSLISSDTLMEVAQKIAKLHKPASADYKKKFGIGKSGTEKADYKMRRDDSSSLGEISKKYYCGKCDKPISQKVASFCWQNKNRFGGKAYCFDCQKLITFPTK